VKDCRKGVRTPSTSTRFRLPAEEVLAKRAGVRQSEDAEVRKSDMEGIFVEFNYNCQVVNKKGV